MALLSAFQTTFDSLIGMCSSIVVSASSLVAPPSRGFFAAGGSSPSRSIKHLSLAPRLYKNAITVHLCKLYLLGKSRAYPQLIWGNDARSFRCSQIRCHGELRVVLTIRRSLINSCKFISTVYYTLIFFNACTVPIVWETLIVAHHAGLTQSAVFPLPRAGG